MTLKELPIGKTATIVSVGGEGALRQHFLDMGIIPKAEITMVKYAPMGDPVEVRIHSYELTLRLADAEKITIENIYEITSEETSEIMKKQSMEDQSTEEQSDVNEEQESTQAQIFAQENNTVEETLQSKETDSSEQVSVETEETDQSLSQEVEPQGKTVNVKSGILLPVLLVTGIAACIAGIIYFTGKIKKIK